MRVREAGSYRAVLVGICAGFCLLLVSLYARRSIGTSYAPPPRSIVICGIEDRPCVTYSVSYHQATHAYGDTPGEGVTDYQNKSISIAWSVDRFKNVEALEHEVFHAVLWERGFRDTDRWQIHDWIYFSEGAFPLLFHDNPEFVKYLAAGY
jgi:hypothetical protein